MAADRVEETVILGLEMIPETKGSEEAVAQLGGALKELSKDAEGAQKAISEVQDAAVRAGSTIKEALRLQTPEQRVGEMTNLMESLGFGKEAEQMVGNIQGQFAKLHPEVQEAAEELSKADEAARKLSKSGQLIVDVIKEESGVWGQATLTAGDHSQALHSLTGSAEDTGRGIAGMGAKARGTQQNFFELGDEAQSLSTELNYADRLLGRVRGGIGTEALGQVLGQVSGIVGILDIVGPVLPLVMNPTVIAAATGAAGFWLLHEFTIGEAMKSLRAKLAEEAETLRGAAAQGYTAEVAGQRITGAEYLAYRPTPYAQELARWGAGGYQGEMPMPPGGVFDKAYPSEALLYGERDLTRGEKDWRIREAMRERYGEEAWRWMAYQQGWTGGNLRAPTTGERAESIMMEAARKQGEEREEARARALAMQARPDLFPDKSWRLQGETRTQPFFTESERAQGELRSAQEAYDRELRRQQEAASRDQYNLMRDNWQEYIDRAPEEQRQARRLQYREWQRQQRLGSYGGDQGENRLPELAERVRSAQGRLSGSAIPVTVVNPRDISSGYRDRSRQTGAEGPFGG